jgi:hypothetical protein
MGSYSQLYLNSYPTYFIKNDYNKEVVNLLFQPDDFIEEDQLNSSRNPLFWGEAYINAEGVYTFTGYRQTVKICRERLGIFGMNPKKAREDFNLARLYAEEYGEYEFPIQNTSFRQYFAQVKDILNNQVIDYGAGRATLRSALLHDALHVNGQTDAAFLFCLLSLLADDMIVEYDLSDIVEGGWLKTTNIAPINHQKIIVLTEGKTDVEFIRDALKLLYPHLYPYYHFIDFNEYKVESSASALVKLVVSFSAANVQHPIVVLFDNDTTGIMEMKRLLRERIPANIKVLPLPISKLASKYPTLGPTGIKKMNVNGLACGIEMYLGQDVLSDNNGLVPILWRGYNDSEQKYQGEIQNKGDVQQRFREKLKKGLPGDFRDIDTILKAIFIAFT